MICAGAIEGERHTSHGPGKIRTRYYCPSGQAPRPGHTTLRLLDPSPPLRHPLLRDGSCRYPVPPRRFPAFCRRRLCGPRLPRSHVACLLSAPCRDDRRLVKLLDRPHYRTQGIFERGIPAAQQEAPGEDARVLPEVRRKNGDHRAVHAHCPDLRALCRRGRRNGLQALHPLQHRGQHRLGADLHTGRLFFRQHTRGQGQLYPCHPRHHRDLPASRHHRIRAGATPGRREGASADTAFRNHAFFTASEGEGAASCIQTRLLSRPPLCYN